MRCPLRFVLFALLALCSPLLVSAQPVAPSADEVRPLAVGKAAPTVACRDVDGNAVSLDAYVGREAVALIFYRGGW